MEKMVKILVDKGFSEEEAKEFIDGILSQSTSLFKYGLRIEYTSGNSFGSFEETEIIDPMWKNPKIVQDNVLAIKEHYKTYKEDIPYDKVKNKWWCIKDKNIYQFSINLKKDDGDTFTISVPWIGYFENLDKIEVIVENLTWNADYD